MPSAVARVTPLVESFSWVLTPGCCVIDIGAGKGLLAQEMTHRLGARVTMVDVAQYNETKLPLIVCDSRALAFGDQSFDLALLSFVLHHSPQPDAILREAWRVADKVIVIENDVRGKLRGLVTQVVDSYPALRYGTPPCHFTRTRDEWLAFFREFADHVTILGEFSLERGFFQNMTVLLSRT